MGLRRARVDRGWAMTLGTGGGKAHKRGGWKESGTARQARSGRFAKGKKVGMHQQEAGPRARGGVDLTVEGEREPGGMADKALHCGRIACSERINSIGAGAGDGAVRRISGHALGIARSCDIKRSRGLSSCDKSASTRRERGDGRKKKNCPHKDARLGEVRAR